MTQLKTAADTRTAYGLLNASEVSREMPPAAVSSLFNPHPSLDVAMDKLVIEGGIPLNGTIDISGSKNAALPILFAAILLDARCTFCNVPVLQDITTTVRLLRMLGLHAEQTGHEVCTEPGSLLPEAPYDLVRTMRASVLCLGPLLAKLGRARVSMPGGCAIGARPVDQHLKAFEQMGARFDLEGGDIVGRCAKLHGARIAFDMPTVGGTENVLMAAVLAEGETILENCAREPEVVDLANFLTCAGAEISGQGTSVMTIHGVDSLACETYSIMPDRIEAGTFIAAAGMTGGELLLRNCPFQELKTVIAKLEEMGMSITETPGGVLARLGKTGLHGTDLKTQPYPGFPTDMQAQTMALMCIAQGTSMVEERIFENRFMHVPELARMGAQIRISGHSAMIRGIRSLTGAQVMASDLRASASLVLAGLAAHGETHVRRIYHLDRGYEQIERKLSACGARIERVEQ